MHDVVAQVVISARDEDLGAGDRVLGLGLGTSISNPTSKGDPNPYSNPNPNLGARDRVRSVRAPLRPRRDLAEVGATLRLGEAHGARRLAGDQLGRVLLLELVGAVREQRVDRALREVGVG